VVQIQPQQHAVAKVRQELNDRLGFAGEPSPPHEWGNEVDIERPQQQSVGRRGRQQARPRLHEERLDRAGLGQPREEESEQRGKSQVHHGPDHRHGGEREIGIERLGADPHGRDPAQEAGHGRLSLLNVHDQQLDHGKPDPAQQPAAQTLPIPPANALLRRGRWWDRWIVGLQTGLTRVLVHGRLRCRRDLCAGIE
jgi:hypothetical protein